MRKSRFNEEQMVAILREADRSSVAEAAKKHKVSEQSIYNLLTRAVEQEPGATGRGVQPGRVGPAVVERGEQRLAGGRVQRQRGGGVEVHRRSHSPHASPDAPYPRQEPKGLLGYARSALRTGAARLVPSAKTRPPARKARRLSPTPGPGRSGSRRTGARLALAAAATALLTSACDVRDTYERSLNLGLPDPITDQAERIQGLWYGSVAAALVVGVFVWGLIFYAVLRYRKNSDELPRQVRYNLPIEVLYTVVPFVIIAVLFYYTAVDENYVNKAQANPDVQVDIVGFQWNWQFNYPDAGVQVTGSPRQPATMYLPVDQRIRFVETSPDVIHSWFVPAFMFKRDVIPGRMNTFEVTIRKEGTFLGRCAEFCGEKHDRMNFFLKVVSQQEFAAYMDKLKANPDAAIGDGAGAAIPTSPEYGLPTGNSEGEGSAK